MFSSVDQRQWGELYSLGVHCSKRTEPCAPGWYSPGVPEVQRQVPIYEQVASHYRALISSGELPSGSELPSVRRLASDWGIANKVAARATALLRDEGWIETRPGKPAVVRKQT